ncbi:hypothetical protein [Gemella cuniculi]|uniref:hypothetical protein n=1 Tax=Gemella cuniculi TaxID=150240 RepID=UPI000488A048|nr:hypothetical protein [Gemella cuniculi]
MKKLLLIAFGIVFGVGSLSGCSTKQEGKKETSQEQTVKKELSDEEIVKESLRKFVPEKNLELDTKLNMNIKVEEHQLTMDLLSNIKIDEKGNILKDYSEEKNEDGNKESENEKVFIKKVDTGYEKYDIVNNNALKANYSTEDTDSIAGLKTVFSTGNTLFDSITEKNYKKDNNELVFTGKVRLKDLGEKLFLSMQEFAEEGAEYVFNNAIPFEAKIDASTQEVKIITLKFKDIINKMLEDQAKESSMSTSETEKVLAEAKENTKGELVLTRKIEKIEEIKFN